MSHMMSPWLLLALTFALSAGDAFETPSWRAILPELVPKEELAPASALNGIEFNLARAVGPALAGLIISAAGVAAAFVANCVSFFGVILVVARWKRPDFASGRRLPETFRGATVERRFDTCRNSPAILKVTVRTGVVMFLSEPRSLLYCRRSLEVSAILPLAMVCCLDVLELAPLAAP